MVIIWLGKHVKQSVEIYRKLQVKLLHTYVAIVLNACNINQEWDVPLTASILLCMCIGGGLTYDNNYVLES